MPHNVSSSHLSRLFLAVTVSQTAFAFNDLDILRSIGQSCYRIFLYQDGAEVFLMSSLWRRAWGKKATKEKCPFHPIMSRVHVINMTHHWGCWPWSSGWGHGCQVTPLCVSVLKVLRVMLPILQGKIYKIIWNPWHEKFAYFSYLCSYVFNSWFI